jgi:hypothetical protein
MKMRHAAAVLLWAAGLAVLVQCGSSASAPTTTPTPSATPTPTPVPTPTPLGVLPAGLSCSPTPPPILRMQLKIHSSDGGRIVLDSKPVVVNQDDYCDRAGFGGWKFCDTRPEGNDQRTACDYMVTGIASDTGRWGPVWYYNDIPCTKVPEKCAMHSENQFLAIARDAGRFMACAQARWPIADGGTSCGSIDVE